MREHGYTEQQIDAGGLRITTTVEQGLPGRRRRRGERGDGRARTPEVLREALVAVDPKTGAVARLLRRRSRHRHRLRAGAAAAGLVDEALRAGRRRSSRASACTARRDGSSPQTFPDREADRCVNSGGASCAACTLKEAITRSLNTTFYGLAYEVGPENVRDVALAGDRPARRLGDGGQPGRQARPWPTRRRAAPARRSASASTRCARSTRPSASPPSPAAASTATRTSSRGSTDNEGTVLLENAGDAGRAGDPRRRRQRRHLRASRTSPHYSDRAPRRRPRGGQQDRYRRARPTRTTPTPGWSGTRPSISTAVWMGTDGREPIVERRRRDHLRLRPARGDLAAVHERRPRRDAEENLPDEAAHRGRHRRGRAEPTTEAPPTRRHRRARRRRHPRRPRRPGPWTRTRDGIPDGEDPDPNDPDVPGDGSDVDSDGDGVPDAVDPAPDDENIPNRRTAGRQTACRRTIPRAADADPAH